MNWGLTIAFIGCAIAISKWIDSKKKDKARTIDEAKKAKAIEERFTVITENHISHLDENFKRLEKRLNIKSEVIDKLTLTIARMDERCQSRHK